MVEKYLLPYMFATLFMASCISLESSPGNATSVPATTTVSQTRAPTGIFQPTVTAEQPATSTPRSSETPAILPPTATAVATITPTATTTFPRYEGPPLEKRNIGVQIHIHREDLRPIVRHLRALDVGWVKVQVSWKLYEPEPGVYAQDRLAELDALVEASTNNNIQVLLNVSKAPEWSRPTTLLDGPPLDYDLYRNFMAFLAERYHGRVSAYELWNEPNLQREWNGPVLSATDLVRLVSAGAAGVREVDPSATIISSAPAVTGINDGTTAIDDRVFLRGMLDAGIAEVVDGIGVHPYGWANPPDSSFDSPDPAVPTHNNHPSFFFKDTLSDYAALLNEYGAENTLWVTEFGWGSFDQLLDDDGEPAQPPPGANFMVDVSEWEQAVYLLRALEMGLESDRVGPMMVWNLNFGPLLGHEYTETGYGILRPDGTPRPAYRALEAVKKT